jgi:hypothetical protein
MASFKQWIQIQEIAISSDGVTDNSPTQTAQATQQVAANWMGNPKNAAAQGGMVTMGTQNKSALSHDLMSAASSAIKTGPSPLKLQTNAPQVGMAIQKSLGLPDILKAPTQLKMMRRK